MCNEMLLSPRSAVTVKSTRGDDIFTFAVAALAANASQDFSVGADAALGALGIPYTVYVSLVQTSVINVADIGIEFRLAGEKRMGFLGAELSTSNGNACAINACDLGVCVGAIENLTIRIKNETLAAFGANATVKIKVRRHFEGDPKFLCASEAEATAANACPTGACAKPQSGQAPVL